MYKFSSDFWEAAAFSTKTLGAVAHTCFLVLLGSFIGQIVVEMILTYNK